MGVFGAINSAIKKPVQKAASAVSKAPGIGKATSVASKAPGMGAVGGAINKMGLGPSAKMAPQSPPMGQSSQMSGGSMQGGVPAYKPPQPQNYMGGPPRPQGGMGQMAQNVGSGMGGMMQRPQLQPMPSQGPSQDFQEQSMSPVPPMTNPVHMSPYNQGPQPGEEMGGQGIGPSPQMMGQSDPRQEALKQMMQSRRQAQY